MTGLQEDIVASMKGDEKALERPQKSKAKKRSVAEVVAELSPKARAALRARAVAIVEAIDALDAESEPEPEEELV
jgi:predicted CopG family antitoxin